MIAIHGLDKAWRGHLTAPVDLTVHHGAKSLAVRVSPAIVVKGDRSQHQNDDQTKKPAHRRPHPASSTRLDRLAKSAHGGGIMAISLENRKRGSGRARPPRSTKSLPAKAVNWRRAKKIRRQSI